LDLYAQFIVRGPPISIVIAVLINEMDAAITTSRLGVCT